MKERAEAAERSWRHLSDGTPCQTSGRTEFAEMAASSSLSELRLLSWLFFSLSLPSLAQGLPARYGALVWPRDVACFG